MFPQTQTDAYVPKKSKWLMQPQTKVAAAAQPLCSLQFQKALQCQELQVHPPRAGDHPPRIQMCKWYRREQLQHTTATAAVIVSCNK